MQQQARLVVLAQLRGGRQGEGDFGAGKGGEGDWVGGGWVDGGVEGVVGWGFAPDVGTWGGGEGEGGEVGGCCFGRFAGHGQRVEENEEGEEHGGLGYIRVWRVGSGR